ncbi:hypothetical protein [Devosia sediminis]|uniref:Uncharacterized protein n=1 Tax=Devosia sediminis TaxID=2798801 RepID=A0A934IW21_9HYPH|nr:hypothetical protein [Devosia sediminis]MBJ3783853.1 hypothetical protein [Devosia sediminis]
MGLLKSRTATSSEAEPFTVRSLGDYHPEYGERLAKLIELQVALSDLRSEAVRLEKQLGDTPRPKIRPAVAALLGEESLDERATLSARFREVQQQIADHQAAVALQSARVEEVKGKATIAACEAVKPEYARRVAAMVNALQSAAEARARYRELLDELDRKEIAWLRLGPFEPNFLGERGDGHIERMAREAMEHGYV